MTTRDPDENGWASSAAAWITRSAEGGDFSRQYVLDTPMMARAKAAGAQEVLDVGCGEGRFCRMLGDVGMQTTGLDPVPAMLDAARAQDTAGNYVQGYAEALPFADQSFDLVFSYLALIDIDDAQAAIAEMARVLRPGGRVLVANLTSFTTSGAAMGWRRCKDTDAILRTLGTYLDTRKNWYEWDGVRIQNWHRPLSDYMGWFLGAGLNLTHFDEPQPHGGPDSKVASYQTFPYLMMMEWQKPG